MDVLFLCPLNGVGEGMHILAKNCTNGIGLKGLIPKGPARKVLAFSVLHRHFHRCTGSHQGQMLHTIHSKKYHLSHVQAPS